MKYSAGILLSANNPTNSRRRLRRSEKFSQHSGNQETSVKYRSVMAPAERSSRVNEQM